MSLFALMLNVRQAVRASLFAVILALLAASFLAAPTPLTAQTFTLTSTSLSPAAVQPGSPSTAALSLQSSNGFDTPVALDCVLITQNLGGTLPACAVSPSSDTPNSTPSVTVTTFGATPAGTYTFNVTATGGSQTPITVALYLTVTDIAQEYTLTVNNTPSPSSVNPGGGAQAVILITPLAGYSGTVTLSCASVTPVVVAAPVCSFASTADPSQESVALTNGEAGTATLTITTFGTTQKGTTRLWSPRIFYAFCLGAPGLALLGVGTGVAKSRQRKFIALLFLLGIAGALLMLPSCSTSNSNSSNNPTSLTTPKNTYSFALSAVDANGVLPSNSTTSAATVMLTVN